MNLLQNQSLTERSLGEKYTSASVGHAISEDENSSLQLNFKSCSDFEDSIIISLSRSAQEESPANSYSSCLHARELKASQEIIQVGGLQLETDSMDGEFSILDEHGIIVQTCDEEISVGGSVQAKAVFERLRGQQTEIGLSLSMGAGEYFLGGPEDPRGQIKNKTLFEVFNTDALGLGGCGRYQNTPVFWSTKGYLLFVLTKEPVTIDFGSRRTAVLEISTFSNQVEVLVAPFDSAASAFKAFRRVFSPPASVPDWSYGLWVSRCFYKDQEELETVLEKSKENSISFDVVNLDARAWMNAETRTDFKWDVSRWDDYPDYIPSLNSRGYKVCLWENPYVSSTSELYAEGDQNGYFAKDDSGNTYPLDWVPDGLDGFPKPPFAGLVDFTNEKARSWWKNLHKPYLKAGVSAFKTDFGEEIPFDCMFSDGRSGYQLRNEYADLYNKCVYEVITEEHGDQGIVWARSANLMAASHPVKWNGDSQTSFRALSASLKGGLTQALGGAIFWSHDVGGFYGRKPNSELYLRWAQVGFWCSHMRLHGMSEREPWEFGEDVLKAFQKELKIRRLLLPYFIYEGKRCVEDCISFIRPIWLEEQDESYLHIEDQFYAGSRFLVAPFLDSRSGRDVTLPVGEWIDLRNGQNIVGPKRFRISESVQTPVYFRSDIRDMSDHDAWLRETVSTVVNMNN